MRLLVQLINLEKIVFDFFKKKSKDVPVEVFIDVKKEVDYNDIEPIAKYFHNETGITFEKNKNILKSKVKSFCILRDIYSFDECLILVKNSPQIRQELINQLTTNETYFFREYAQIEDLVKSVKSSKQYVEILCAPCATGEEPYSIAISLLEAGVSEFGITGIDISQEALERAYEGVYSSRNVKKLSQDIISKYFTCRDDKYYINSNIKNMVILKHANIFDDDFLNIGKFDYVFSRNMLIYFDKETKIKAKDILQKALKNSSNKVYFGHADLF